MILKIGFCLSVLEGGEGGVASVAHFSTGHEQTQYNRVCYFHLFGVSLASMGSNYSELISTADGVVPYGGRKTSPRTSS